LVGLSDDNHNLIDVLTTAPYTNTVYEEYISNTTHTLIQHTQSKATQIQYDNNEERGGRKDTMTNFIQYYDFLILNIFIR
jgi:hypothetical protein